MSLPRSGRLGRDEAGGGRLRAPRRHRSWSMIGGQPHFVLLALGEATFRDPRLSSADAARVRDGLVEYLSSSAWGTIALNASQCYRWVIESPRPSRRGFVAVLKGTCRFWDEYVGLGRRFFAGAAGALTFPETLPLARYVLANSGHDPRQYVETIPRHPGRPSWGDIKRICAEHDVVRLVREDDRFGTNLCGVITSVMVRPRCRAPGTPDFEAQPTKAVR